MEGVGRIPVIRVGVLGLITISVYGSWYYAFGVLLDAIILDTGWEEPVLTTAFAGSLLVGGVGSLAGGLILDRLGSRLVFGLAALLGLAAFQVAGLTESSAVFAFAVALGGGAYAALGFYHVTQTAAVRISPEASVKAIAVLTIWGAFASAIYIPLAAWMVENNGWRPTLRILTMTAAVALALGALLVDTRVGEAPRAKLVVSELKDSLRLPATRRFVIAVALIGMGVSTVLVYQVPAMTAAGLSLGAASFWAGFRGFAQLGGRLPLMPIVSRLGIAGSLRLAVGAITFGMLVLAVAGTSWLAAVYALVAGFGIGALSPLQGMRAREVFGASSLGTAMGLLTFLFLVAGAIGPAVAGVIASATESRALPVAAGAVVTFGAALLLRSPTRSDEGSGGSKPSSSGLL